jgi:hypothetical protein
MERPKLKLLEDHQATLRSFTEAACTEDECPVCGARPSTPDRARAARSGGLATSSTQTARVRKHQKCKKKDAWIGDLAIGRHRIDLPLSRLKCVRTAEILL